MAFNDLPQEIRQELDRALGNPHLSTLRPIIERLRQFASTSALSDENYRILIEILNRISDDVACGARASEELADSRVVREYARFLQPGWRPETVNQAQSIIQLLFDRHGPEKPEVEPHPVPIVLLAMTSAQAAALASGDTIADAPESACQDFERLLGVLESHELQEGWVGHYGERPEDWRPFTLGDDAESFSAIVESAFEAFRGRPEPLAPRFIDPGILESDRVELQRLRRKGCLVVIDSISLHHPKIQQAFHSSLLDVFPTVAVARVAPLEDVLQLEIRLVRLIERQVDHEFHQRRSVDFDDFCRCPRDRTELATFLKAGTDRLMKVASENRVHWFRGTEPKT